MSKRNETLNAKMSKRNEIDAEINRVNFEISRLYSKKTPLQKYTIGDANLVSLARNAQAVADEAKNVARGSGLV